MENSFASIITADGNSCSKAAQFLRDGRLVAVPTETVYGLAARADSDAAVAAIYRAKGRPDFNPLIVHVSSFAAAEVLAHCDERAQLLASAFWPGPLTLVLPRREEAALAHAVSAGLPTLAIRCPAHPVMRAVLAQAGVPLAAPSANRSGAVSPTTAQHVAASLGDRIDLILDGGICSAGIESTIIALRDGGGWQLLRSGPITENQIAEVLGIRADGTISAEAIEAPGQLASHYSPGKPVRLNVIEAEQGEFHIGFGAVAGSYNLSQTGDYEEAAANLYKALHYAAQADQSRVAVAPIPEDGIGVAINDRLRRAAV